MKYLGRLILVPLLAAGLCGCGGSPTQPALPDAKAQPAQNSPGDQPVAPATYHKVRGPAVAGMFYPRHRQNLVENVDKLLAEARPKPVKNLRGLVCPHAGYRFSGETAAIGYKLLEGKDFRTVVVMAPTHTAAFKGASIPDVDAYQTPLGMIPLSTKAADLGKVKPFVVNPLCDVQRPGWWRRAPKELPPFGEDTPHSWEHSLEVQLPFLQRTLKKFALVPIVFGQQLDAEALARTLLKYVNEKTLLVASSDLSHYQPYETAKGMDTACVKAICSLNPEWMERQSACGKGPILALMHLARLKGWKAELLDYRNSGDVTGDKSQGVVGYAAVAFYDPGEAAAEQETPQPAGQDEFTPQDRKFLLELARNSVTAAVNRKKPPAVDADELAEKFTEPRACFVTLTKESRLRGCIGSIFPQQPLWRSVISGAVSAATADHRFSPVTPDELDQIEVEVSVLTLPRRLEFESSEELLKKLRPNVDGVVLRVGRRQSTYLPQVWEQISDKQEFLSHLAEKAGLPSSAWRGDDATVLVYQVEAFHESEQ